MLNQVVVLVLHAAIVCSTLSGWGLGQEAEAVESHGVTLQVLKEEEVNDLVTGKHRMRAIEITAEPGQPIGQLAHGSFGIGYIFSGAITSQDEPSQSYKAG